MTIYVFNSPILTNYGSWHFSGPLSVANAQALLKQGFQSAVGHESTARFLSDLLAITIPMNRMHVNLQPGDQALVFRLQQRQQEGKLLSAQDLSVMDYDLSLLERLE